jgi:hypothetical protein
VNLGFHLAGQWRGPVDALDALGARIVAEKMFTFHATG